MNQFWIKYTIPGETIESAVPVAIDDAGNAVLCDGAYDAYDYFYKSDDAPDGDLREDAPYFLFEDAVCLCALKLAHEPEQSEVGYNVCGEHFIFRKAYLDHYGN